MGDAPKDGDESEQDEAKPTKVVMEELTLEVRARCMQLDYEGRSDGRSMHTILTHIAPRHLVLCHGSSRVCHLLLAAQCTHASLGSGGFIRLASWPLSCLAMSCNFQITYSLCQQAGCRFMPYMQEYANRLATMR